MTPERWKEIRPILESALATAPAHRLAVLDEACAQDPTLRDEVESLILSHEEAATSALNPASALQLIPEYEARFRLLPGKRVGAYEILEEIAVGGMGAVYRAVRADGQYRQQVALKIVRAELGAEFVATRFKNERQILASLDHPNIAKILDGGTTADGIPYFVMELLDDKNGGGLPITQYCDQHRLSIDQRLIIFRKVCSAVHYAHQHLVVHRDIKPTNILITEEGVPKLLDFGIAKILDSTPLAENATLTAAGLWMMTPEYASPEQLRGETITTATDVYSLGLILYQLLAGRPAYPFASRQPLEITRIVLETEPEKPSIAVRRAKNAKDEKDGVDAPTPELLSGQRGDSPDRLQRRLAGDLDNIVLKAIRKAPRERYDSVENFSEDLRRHLEGLPVLARKQTIGYRCRKFLIRHKLQVAAAGVVLLSLLAGMVLTLREARIATANEIRAERRFNDVRRLANSLIFDIHDSIQDLPGATPARKLIVEKALQYLDSLSRESSGDASLQRELGAAYKKIGDVQGYPYSANLGDAAGARKSYEKSLAIRQNLFASNPKNMGDALGVAESSRLLADILLETSATNSALETAKRAVEIAERTDGAYPSNVEVLEELSRDYEGEADILGGNFNLSNVGDIPAALILRRKQLNADERIISLKPNDPAVNRMLAASEARMGDQLLLDGQTREALPYYLRAQQVFEKLAKESQATRTMEFLDDMYQRVVVVQTTNGDFPQALVTSRKALEISRKLSAADSRSSKGRLALASDYSNLADTTSRLGQKQGANAAISQALTLANELVALDPNNTEFLGVRAAIYVEAGDVFRRVPDPSKSIFYYREALSEVSQIQSNDPNNVDARLRVAAIRNRVGEMLTRQKNFNGAREMFDKALEMAKPETISAHPNEQALYSTADSYANLAEIDAALAAKGSFTVKERAGHWMNALSLAQQSLKVWSQIKEPGVQSPDGFDCIQPSVVSQRLSKYKAASASFHRATEVR